MDAINFVLLYFDGVLFLSWGVYELGGATTNDLPNQFDYPANKKAFRFLLYFSDRDSFDCTFISSMFTVCVFMFEYSVRKCKTTRHQHS